MRYSTAHQSRTGTRSANQDRVACAETDGRVLLVVADGLGGHKGGERAAEVAMETIVGFFNDVTDDVIREPAAFLVLALAEAHRRVNDIASPTDGKDNGPGTTAVVCLIQNGYASWAHVGDSRLYHFRGSELLNRTLDDTTSERMRLDGVISEEEMRSPLWQGHLLQCIGGVRQPQVHVTSETALEPDDLLVLCSDGFWRGVSAPELAGSLTGTDIDKALANLMKRVERTMGGDCDNLSAAVLRWQDARPSEPPAGSSDPETLDQQALWKKAQRVRTPAKAHATQSAPAAATSRRGAKSKGENRPAKALRDDMDAAIEELEGFVRKLERWL